MGDGFKLKASIPEVDDHFTIAEARCDDLQEKIDAVKGLKKKRKLKRRSMTRITDLPPVDNVPFITVHTQPKKEVSPQASRLRRVEAPRGYLDPATVEQQRMIRGYHRHRPLQIDDKTKGKRLNEDLVLPSSKPKPRRDRVEGGDSFLGLEDDRAVNNEVACGDDETLDLDTDNEVHEQHFDDMSTPNHKKMFNLKMLNKKPQVVQRKPGVRVNPNEVPASQWTHVAETETPWSSVPLRRRRRPTFTQPHIDVSATDDKHDERPVVELFNKTRPAEADTRPEPRGKTTGKKSWHAAPPLHIFSMDRSQSGLAQIRDNNNLRQFSPPRNENMENDTIEHDGIHTETLKEKDVHRHPHRVHYRSRRYELPTVASQMKQSGVRYYQGTVNHTNIPFIVSKSTAPSHNIGVNIQQVLNGLKIQQPLSGIPFTIAHHMGLGYIPNCGTKSSVMQNQPCLDGREMNSIRVGRKLVRLPSYKYMSYNRLLSLYREGEGMVPRFLRAISRPHYFYTSMYNLASREDYDGATSKGLGGASHEARHSLAEYASLYREYEQLDRSSKEGQLEPQLARRKEEIACELAAREDHIRKVVQDYRTVGDAEPASLRASASTAADDYRCSALSLAGVAHP